MKYLITVIFIAVCISSFGQDTIKASAKDTAIFEIVDEPPYYTGGEAARQKFIASNLVYPKKAIDSLVQGTVLVRFVVEKDGSVSNVEIARDIGYGCGEEAARVIGMMTWNPGRQAGVPKRVKVAMPIKFRLK